MVTKTITIVEEAYNALSREKLPKESFSDTIKRITRKNNDLTEFFGCIEEYEAKNIEAEIKKQRKIDSKRDVWSKK